MNCVDWSQSQSTILSVGAAPDAQWSGKADIMSTPPGDRINSWRAAIGKLVLIGIVQSVALPGHITYAQYNDCAKLGQNLPSGEIALESDPSLWRASNFVETVKRKCARLHKLVQR